MKYFAENLRKYRVMKGYTQENIADFLNVTPQSGLQMGDAGVHLDKDTTPIPR